MKKEYLYTICAVLGFVFIMVALICSYFYKVLYFQAFGGAYTDAIEYLWQFPLNVVLIVNVVLLIVGIEGLFGEKIHKK